MERESVSRRKLLAGIPGTIGIAGATVGMFGSGQASAATGTDVKFGIASYSFRKFSPAKAIQMAKELNVRYLSVKDIHLPYDSTPAQIDAAKKEFEAGGIVLVGCGVVYFKEDSDSDIRSKFEYAKRAGFSMITCMPARNVLPKLEKYVKEYDIKIAVHNHGPEDPNFPTPQSALKVVKNMDPRCGLCIDIGHTSRTGTDIIGSVVEAGPRLLDMHVKDLADKSVKESQVAVGEGKLPLPQIFLQLMKMNYGGYVNLEYEIHADDPLPGMQKSFSYMRGVLAGIQATKQAT
jgi:sugar phosphate isomerase/epimerase